MAMDPDLASALKIVGSALGAWGASWLANRRERREWLAKQEAAQDQQLAKQADRLAAGWSEMTTQAREIISRLQVETIDAKTRAAVLEEGNAKLERELAELRARYAAALAELEGLREQMSRRPARKRDVIPPQE